MGKLMEDVRAWKERYRQKKKEMEKEKRKKKGFKSKSKIYVALIKITEVSDEED